MFSLQNSFSNQLKTSFCFGMFWLLLGLSNAVWAVDSLSRDETHRGVVDLRPYQIYPENRIGNGLYLEKELLITHPKQMILEIEPISMTRSHVYLYQNKTADLGLDVINSKEDGDGRIMQIDPEFYQYTNRNLGIQRVFRIFKGKIKSLLDNTRTGTGVSVSAKHAVFYHITNSQNVNRINETGNTVTETQVSYRLHVVDRRQDGFASIYKLQIKDGRYRLNLKWENDHTVSYKGSDGKMNMIDLKKYLPHFFN